MLTTSTGTLFWFTGLAGAGKTTIGKRFYEHIKSLERHVVILDGDTLREVFGDVTCYSMEDRRKLAMRYSRLAHMLTEQEIDVVCCTISMFHEVREWNRGNIPSYQEIYIKVPIDILIERDQKGLYSAVLDGEIQNVIGVDIEAEEPKHPDIIIENDGTLSFAEIDDLLFEKLCKGVS